MREPVVSTTRALSWCCLLLVLSGPARAVASSASPDVTTDVTTDVTYVLGILERGPAWTPERTPHTDSIQAGHMANIGRMANAGVLAAAGPFAGSGPTRGIFVWEPGTRAIDSLLAGDPAIASGRLTCRRYAWRAPAGLGKDYQRRLAERGLEAQGQPDSMVVFGFVMLRQAPAGGASPAAAARGLERSRRDYHQKLRAAGRLIFSGDVEGEGDLKSVLIMIGDSATVAAAAAQDPAVRAHQLTAQVLGWWNAWGTVPGH